MRTVAIFLAVMVCGLAAVHSAWGKPLETYTEESYVFLATDIVEVTLGESVTIEKIPAFRATVTRVFKGVHKEGDVMNVGGVDLFTIRETTQDMNSRDLTKGDRVLVFLKGAQGVGDAAVFEPLPGGLYTVKPDGIHRSFQGNNPGPYEDWTLVKMTAAEFRAGLEREVAEMGRLEVDIKTKKLPEEMDWFIGELKKRRDVYGDRITPVIAGRIVDTHDPALVVKAMADGGTWRPLVAGLRMPEGREYLVRQIGDPKVALETRKMLARSLPLVYLNYYDDHGKPPADVPAKELSENHQMMTRLAEIARQPGAPVELISCVLEQMWQAYPTQQEGEEMAADRNGALAILKTVYDQPATAEPVRFFIEAFTLRADVKAYRELHSVCGDVPTLVTIGFPPQAPRVQEAKPGMFNVEIRRELKDVPQGTLWYNIIATNTETGKQYVLYSEADHGGYYWSCDVALPADAPWGEYRIQYMTIQNGEKFYGRGFIMSSLAGR